MAIDINHNFVMKSDGPDSNYKDECWKVKPYSLKSYICVNDIKTELYKKRNNIANDGGISTSYQTKTSTNAFPNSYLSGSTLVGDSMISEYIPSDNKGNHPLWDPLNEENDVCVCYCEEDSWDALDIGDDVSLSSSSTSNNSWLTSQSLSLSGVSKKSLSDANVISINIESPPLDNNGANSESSKDSLTKLLNDKGAYTQTTTTKNSMVSNLKSSLKKLKSSIQNSSTIILNSYTFNPRTTDDIIPEIKSSLPLQHEMTTFKETATLEEPFILRKSFRSFKNRELRVNSEFLRKYAFDYNSRLEGLLPCVHTSEEITQILISRPSLKKFHLDYNLYKISGISKEKLWQNIILPPRSDNSPKNAINYEGYIFLGGEKGNFSSLITSNGDYLPWGFGALSIKPAGILSKGKSFYNSSSPSSGVTNTQYTIKGWCNSRWMDVSKETELLS